MTANERAAFLIGQLSIKVCELEATVEAQAQAIKELQEKLEKKSDG